MRHKGFNIVNIHPTIKFVAKIAIKHMPQKLKQRSYFFTDFDEIDFIDMRSFPVDCGGDVEVEKFIGNYSWSEFVKES